MSFNPLIQPKKINPRIIPTFYYFGVKVTNGITISSKETPPCW